MRELTSGTLIRRLMRYAISAASSEQQMQRFMRQAERDENSWWLGCVLLWMHSGFQTVEVGARLAASLASTSGLSDLKMPWSSFVVRLENAPIEVAGKPIELIMVNELDGKTSIVITKGSRVVSRSGSLASIAAGEDYDGSAEDRALSLSCRLVLGCIAELESGEGKRRAFVRGDREGTKPSDPKLSPWVLGRPVTLDVTEEVRAYCAGGGTAPSVRTLVRGHWRQQPCGPRNEQRKLIHIEPFWRGPEEAAVVVRPHRIGASA